MTNRLFQYYRTGTSRSAQRFGMNTITHLIPSQALLKEHQAPRSLQSISRLQMHWLRFQNQKSQIVKSIRTSSSTSNSRRLKRLIARSRRTMKNSEDFLIQGQRSRLSLNQCHLRSLGMKRWNSSRQSRLRLKSRQTQVRGSKLRVRQKNTLIRRDSSTRRCGN